MSYSSATSYVKLSPNYYKGRTYNGEQRKIDTITIHHTAGVLSVEALGNDFSNSNRKASSNYGVGNDGRIACFVEEENTAWTTSSRNNDSRAITIEVVNSKTGDPWPVSEQAYAALCGLLVDICRRNGIDRLRWRDDKNLIGRPDLQNMTIHRWFSATACPGPYLYDRMGAIAAAVNKKLEELEDPEMQRFNTEAQIASECDWALPTITKLIDAGALGGNGEKDANGRPTDLNLSVDMMRAFVVNDRMGVYDRE